MTHLVEQQAVRTMFSTATEQLQRGNWLGNAQNWEGVIIKLVTNSGAPRSKFSDEPAHTAMHCPNDLHAISQIGHL